MKSYKFTEYLTHTEQALTELYTWYETVKGLEITDREKDLIKNVYWTGARDSANHIKLHSGFKFS